MKNIPFVANHEDDMHCVSAIFRMINQHFFGKDLAWSQIDKILKAQKGKGTWTFMGEMYLAKKGLNIVNIEPTDYRKLWKEGPEYLKKIVGKKTADYYIKKSNISSIIRYIPEYLKTIRHETRRASISEIIKFLKKGCLIGAEVNSSILNGKSGFSLHFVLLYDVQGKTISIHDPGLPPVKGRHVSIERFKKCFHFPGASGGIVVFGGKYER